MGEVLRDEELFHTEQYINLGGQKDDVEECDSSTMKVCHIFMGEVKQAFTRMGKGKVRDSQTIGLISYLITCYTDTILVEPKIFQSLVKCLYFKLT